MSLENAIVAEIADNTDGMTYEEARYWVENDAICSAGSVSGLIYYNDTEKFFDDHEEEILDLAKEYDFTVDPVEVGMTGFKNTMAWFAFEALKDPIFENRFSEDDYEQEEAA